MRSYTDAVAVPASTVNNATIRDVNLAASPGGSAFIKWTRGVTLERCVGSSITMASSERMRLVDTDSLGTGFNSMHDCKIERGNFATLYYEEGCMDWDVSGTIVNGGAPHGIRANDRSAERLRFNGVVIRNIRNGSPTDIVASDSSFANGRIESVPAWTTAYMAGDRLNVAGNRFEGTVQINLGAGCIVTGNHGVVYGALQSSGQAVANPDSKFVPGWRVW